MTTFTKNELYNAVLAAKIAREDDSEYRTVIDEAMEEEDLLEKIESLDIYEQDKFQSIIEDCEERFRERFDIIDNMQREDFDNNKQYQISRRNAISELEEDIYDNFDEEFKED